MLFSSAQKLLSNELRMNIYSTRKKMDFEIKKENENRKEIKKGTDTDKSPVSHFDIDFLFQNALVLIDHADYQMALSLLDAVVAGNPSHSEGLKWKAYCYKKIGKIESSAQECVKWCYVNPGEESFFEAAECFYELAQDDLAKDYYNRALQVIDYDSPYLFHIYKKLGNISVKIQDFDSAEEYYNKAYIQNSHSDDLFVNYGTLEIQKENYDLAIDRFKQAIDLNSNNDKAWIGLALIYRSRGDYDLSWADLKKALDLNVKNTTALKLCVDWSLQEMEYDFAIQKLELYLTPETETADWLYTYAGLLLKNGDWAKTKMICNAIIKKYPGYIQAVELYKIADKKVVS